MKTISIAMTLLGLILFSGTTIAHDTRGYSNQYNGQYNDSRYHRNQSRNNRGQSRNHAYVLDIVPVYRAVSHRHTRVGSCRSSSSSHNHTGAIVGGVIGGVIGHEIGHSGHRGGHRNAATAAGVLVGAVIGNQYDHRNSSVRCNSNTRGGKKLTGYKLTYKYRGRVHNTFVKRKPPQYFRIDQLRHYS